MYDKTSLPDKDHCFTCHQVHHIGLEKPSYLPSVKTFRRHPKFNPRLPKIKWTKFKKQTNKKTVGNKK